MKRPFVYALAAALAVAWMAAPASAKPVPTQELGVFAYVFSMVQTAYVREMPAERLLSGAMNGLLKTLDPYSLYLDKKAYAEFRADNEGRLTGIGAEISVKGGQLHVIAPLDGSAAADAGLEPGDAILKIDGVVTRDMSLADAVRMLRGEEGTRVTLTVSRAGAAPRELELTRRLLNVKGIREARRLADGTVYVRIAEFQKQTADDFREALLTLAPQKGLVIDLRSNPGGLLEAAVGVAGNFIPRGKSVVETRGRHRSKNRLYVSKNRDTMRPGPIAVLVNRGSASGSEIVAGALQDHGLARVFGQKTYGKGCVQTLTALKDGSAVRITTSHYHTPNGRQIHEIGIEPDEMAAESAPGDAVLEAALEWIASRREGT